MKVSAQYAEAHLKELLAATESGEDVEISRPDKPAVRLALVPPAATGNRSGMFGSGKGKIRAADDWDSPETNAEIARLFNDGPTFPPDAEK
jgi:antitoxin (DNA-binding transcriptional repressor) of toxin-antitoxin stability system